MYLSFRPPKSIIANSLTSLIQKQPLDQNDIIKKISKVRLVQDNELIKMTTEQLHWWKQPRNSNIYNFHSVFVDTDFDF